MVMRWFNFLKNGINTGVLFTYYVHLGTFSARNYYACVVLVGAILSLRRYLRGLAPLVAMSDVKQ